MKVQTDMFKINQDGYCGKYWTIKKKIRVGLLRWRWKELHGLNSHGHGTNWFASYDEAFAGMKALLTVKDKSFKITYGSEDVVEELDLTKEAK